ncbi:MAG: 5-formyltetrahydrofolate cyclo-ligase [Selenomonadaceae bacterium]|nr:5-formyltetrahydrofolate cyclo-ligase [Selenomonadaceae bacterium]
MNNKILEQKKILRKEMRSKRSALTEEDRKIASHKIISRLINDPNYKNSKTIMAYVSMPEEIQLNELFDDAFANKKILAVPLIVGRGTMRPVFLPSMDSLVVGDFGILTVRQDQRSFVEFDDIDCVIVPGAAFDRSGNRLGLGGGYYDRFLKRVPKAKRIALAFNFELCDKIPVAEYDTKMDIIITEDETFLFDRE